ncbi:signal peptidase I [Arthrobacter sp. Leaf234]|uniref:signal peptidase I n=1 Tax=Arthrobacter sp. Leaf234 TaxID=1736303 RepID=UPI000A950F05|nr:signal peptidase I [Arthrobacter sp. Leaf234]
MTTIDFPSFSSGPRAAVRTSPAPVASVRSGDSGAPPVRADPRRSVVARLASLLGTLLMIVAVIAVLFFAIGPRFLGYQTATMLTGSMAPGIMPGDVVVTTLQPVGGIEVGDVISYHIPVEDHRVETHRVTEVVRGADGTTAVRTQGDANDAVDPWLATLEGENVYQAAAVIPEVGNVIRALRTPAVSHILVYGVPAVLVGALLLMIWSRREEDDDDASEPAPGSATPAGSVGGSGHVPGSSPRTDHPVLDRGILDNLGVELSSHAGALLFAGTFVEMLPQRIGAVEAALTARDADAAVVALLSLTVSASMVGARRLEEESSAALELIGRPITHRALVARLRQHGADVSTALDAIRHQDVHPH